jgi:tRNA uracil 4-sulfurtransferase
MSQLAIVVHYHELWLKGGNRRFFASKLASNLRLALAGIPVEKIIRPNDRLIIHLGETASVEKALRRIGRVSGIAYYALARPVARDIEALCSAAWEEIEPLAFSTFAVRAKRSDKSFPHNSSQIERIAGRFLLDRLGAVDRNAHVKLNEPDVTCRIEITSGPALVYARKIAGPGGLPANTAGKMTCLLSGGFDSAVAAYQMMKRGAHLSFVHFYGTGARPGESSVHVARELVRQLAPWQFTAKLYRVPFEEIQREIVRYAPEACRVLLYRRMMLRISEIFARRNGALALVTGDSLGQVASQTLHNMVSVEAAATMPVFRPLAGTDKLEIIETARKIGTHDISSEPFHDCCPVFLPRSPALHANPAELEAAEAKLDIPLLTSQGVKSATLETFRYIGDRVESVESLPKPRQNAALA